jgi:autotransporter-associated beta strand protein
VGSGGTLTLGYGNVLTDTSTASLAGRLVLTGTAGTTPETLMTYTSETGSFTGVTGVPPGDTLLYSSTALELVVGSSGPATLTWNNAGGSGDGITWDTVQQNWNNGSAVTAYSNNSNGSSGDNVTFNDNNNGHYNVSIPGIVTPSSTTFNNSSGNYNISGAGGISGPGSLTKFGTASVTLATSNNYSGGTLVNAGTLVIASATAFPANSNLTIAPGAVVDITNQHLVIANASIGAITSDVAAAYNNGAWNGSSAAVAMITSSTAAADTSHLTAVGVATGLTSFEGQNVSSSAVLVKYTYYGDANLDGHVDGTDYSRIDNGYLSQGALTGWYNGDFNYDGVINGSDYTLIDNAYNTQGAAIAAEEATATAQIAGGASAVPEPTALSLLGIAAVGLLGRRRKSC